MFISDEELEELMSTYYPIEDEDDADMDTRKAYKCSHKNIKETIGFSSIYRDCLDCGAKLD